MPWGIWGVYWESIKTTGVFDCTFLNIKISISLWSLTWAWRFIYLTGFLHLSEDISWCLIEVNVYSDLDLESFLWNICHVRKNTRVENENIICSNSFRAACFRFRFWSSELSYIIYKYFNGKLLDFLLIIKTSFSPIKYFKLKTYSPALHGIKLKQNAPYYEVWLNSFRAKACLSSDLEFTAFIHFI